MQRRYSNGYRKASEWSRAPCNDHCHHSSVEESLKNRTPQVGVYVCVCKSAIVSGHHQYYQPPNSTTAQWLRGKRCCDPKRTKTRADQTGTHKLFAASFQSYFWELKGIGTGKKALTIGYSVIYWFLRDHQHQQQHRQCLLFGCSILFIQHVLYEMFYNTSTLHCFVAYPRKT